MALEEVTFYNIVGDEVNLTNLVNQMIDYYDQKREAGETRLTDFNEGSEIRNLLEAYAVLAYAILEDENEAGKLPFINYSYGTYLDEIGANPFINLPRIMGASAEGVVTFTLTDAQAEDFVIPANTLLENTNGLEYLTDSDCLIIAGETTGEANVVCISDGEEGNVDIGELNVISDLDVDTTLVSVTNLEAITGGSDYEDDEVYRQRLLDNVRAEGFGSLDYYNSLAESVDGVHDVKFVNDATYTRKILVNGDVKPTPSDVLLSVLTLFSDVSKVVLNHTFTVDKPAYTFANLKITLSVVTSMSSTELTEALTYLFDGGDYQSGTYEGLYIDEVLTRDRIINFFELYENVVEVTSVKVGNDEITSLTPDPNGVLKLGTVTFTQNEV